MADISKINLGGVEYDIRDQKLKEDVEKKADKTYVDEETERVVGYAEEVADNAEKAAKKYADDKKVAKVDGKQLSTEDFTTALKQKLEGLTNYDDADVRSAITELQNNLNAIVNGDATSAIDSIQEILAFLSTITDTQTLAGIVADLKQYVDDKVASGGGGGTAAEGAKLYPIYSPKLMETDSITEEQKAANKAAFEAAARGDNMWCYAVVEGSIHFNASIVFTGDSEMLILAFESHSIYQEITATLTNVIIKPDGSILHEAQYEVTSPSIERVEEMIAQSGGGGGEGESTADLYPSEYSDEFNDDFTI